MLKYNASTFTLICCAAALMPVVARASLIDGSQFSFSTDVTIGAISMSWRCNQPGDTACNVPPSNKGDFAVSSSTGSFAEYNGSFGLITDINNAAQPLNALFSLPDFMTFDLNSDLTIELTFIPLGNKPVSTDCAGLADCTPRNNLLITPTNPQGLSAFNLDANLDGTALEFGVVGTVHQAGGATAEISGLYTAEFLGLNPQQTLALLEDGTPVTFQADLSLPLTQASAPEPGSILLSGIGLLGLGLVGSRRLSRIR